MKQDYFVKSRSKSWDDYLEALAEYEKKPSHARRLAPQEFVASYRNIARDLAVAHSRNYSNDLVNRLNDLAVRGHNIVYVSRSGWMAKFLEFLSHGFPQSVREHGRILLLSVCLVMIPALIVSALIVEDDQNVHSVLSAGMIEQIETMYDPNARSPGQITEADSRVHAFGLYILNNASIGLRTFALGIFFGLGTVYVLVYNGVILSAIFTHLLVAGYSSTLLPFVAGHSAMELTAVAIAGAAGLRLGKATVAPGELSRSTAILQGGRKAVVLAFGSFLMFVAAAFIEAFWSALQLLPTIKYTVGIVMWLLVIGYFMFIGRRGDQSSTTASSQFTT
ncbi:MAG: stage II sporulation protein M [Gammaproteobacteria bacterium]|nr:stage II sporulation protein M [Gammaproteobacteria bacterium]